MHLPPRLDADLARHHGGAYRDSVTDALAQVRDVLDRPSTTLVFGGHFSAGKSSLLNLLLGRPLLPVSDFPETGAACFITAGTTDRITTVDGDTRRQLPCTTASIAKAVSLLAEDGAYRAEVVGASRRVLIELADSPVASGGRWVDSPGINDTPDMTRRAAAVAAEGDLLVWVVNSRQPVATVEEDFLREHRERFGAESVAVIVNVFLEEDTPEQWKHFVTVRQEAHLNRLAYAFDGVLPAEVVFVSAHAAAAHPSGYGGPEARALIARLTDRAAGTIGAARRARAAKLLRATAEEAQDRQRAEHALLHQQRTEADLTRQEIAAAEQRFRSTVNAELERMLETWAVRARGCGNRIASGLDQGPVLRDSTYGDQLTARVREAAQVEGEALAQAVNHEARRTGHTPLGSRATARLLKILVPDPLTVEVPGRFAGKLPEVRAEGLGSQVSGRVSSMMPKLSWKALHNIDTAVTAAAASVQMARDAAEAAMPDRTKVKANVREAAAGSARRMPDRWRKKVLAEIFASCVPLADPPADPDPAAVETLGTLERTLSKWLAETEVGGRR